MLDTKPELLRYTLDYTTLTKELYEKHNHLYKTFLIGFKLCQCHNGYEATKVNKANNKYTRVTYKKIKNKNEIIEKYNLLSKEYIEVLKNLEEVAKQKRGM